MPESFQINPKSTLVINRSRVVGGRTSTREQVRDEQEGLARETETRTVTRIDDVEERKAGENLAMRATMIVRKRTTTTIIGMLASADVVPSMIADLDAMRPEVEAFNAGALTCRVELGILPIEIAVALGAEAARALADHVREELGELHKALRSGDVRACKRVLNRAKNLRALSVGIQAESIQFAIEEGATRTIEIQRRIDASEAPESAGRSVDLSMIEAGIGMFTYSAPASTMALATGI